MAYPRFQRSRDFKLNVVNTQFTITSTSWVNATGASDIVLSAQAGDVVEVQMEARYDGQTNGGEYKFIDVATVVGGSPTNYFGFNSSEPATGEGIHAWYGSGQNLGDFQSIGGGSARVLLAGDIESGKVTLRLRVRGNTVNGRDIVIYKWWAKNLGPEDPN